MLWPNVPLNLVASVSPTNHRGKQRVELVTFEYLFQIALSTGCAFVQWFVHGWNQSAIDFYKHHGALDYSAEEGERVFGMPRGTMKDFVAKHLPDVS